MKRSNPENKVRNAYIKAYKFYVLTGDILWWKILQAENEQWTPAGTLDSVVCVDQRNGSICLWFNEFKAPGKRVVRKRSTGGKLEENYRFEQKKFVEKMSGKPKILCTITDSIKHFHSNLKKAREI